MFIRPGRQMKTSHAATYPYNLLTTNLNTFQFKPWSQKWYIFFKTKFGTNSPPPTLDRLAQDMELLVKELNFCYSQTRPTVLNT